MLNKKDWYQARDNCTKELNAGGDFEGFSLGVIIDHQVNSNYAIQLMTLISLNILVRWCRNITIQIPDNSICMLPFQKGACLKNILGKMMHEADPYGRFIFDAVDENSHHKILVIGIAGQNLKKPYVWINGAGWIAGVGYGNNTPFPFFNEDINPIGPAFASCLGVAEVYRQFIRTPPSNAYKIWYSLYDFNKTVDDPRQLKNGKYIEEYDFGRIHQIGCGAVGSSLDFLISLTGWKAEINLIDYDKVEETNCNRSLIFSFQDAADKKKKINACADVLRSGLLSPLPFDGSYSDFIRKEGFLNKPPDLILSLANEQNIWSTIQNNFPPMVLHATTTPNWGLNFGRHLPLKEWCILCRFSTELDSKYTPQCGEGVITHADNQHKQTLGVLPFLSPASAILMLSEMAKIALGDCYPINKNFIEFSMRLPIGNFLQIQQTKNSCICNEQSLDFYPAEIKKTKFWRFVS